MRVGAPYNPSAHAWAVQLSQMTGRAAGHQSSPTDRPVEPPGAINNDTVTRRPGGYTFDIRA
jgi:hypothetical protein